MAVRERTEALVVELEVTHKVGLWDGGGLFAREVKRKILIKITILTGTPTVITNPVTITNTL